MTKWKERSWRRSVWSVGALKVLSAALLSIGLLVAPAVAAEAGWEAQNPRAATYVLSGVWGLASDDVFAVGSRGTILHYDGTKWSQMQSGTKNNLEGVWGTASDDVFTVGDGGTILHYDGDKWSSMKGGKDELFLSVGGTGPDDVYAVGQGSGGTGGVGIIFRYDGKTWTEVNTTGFSCVDIWGTAEDGIFVISTNPRAFLHFDGEEWSNPSKIPARNPAAGLWGFSGSDMFVVGDDGIAFHFSGEKWSRMTSGTKLYLDKVWGSASDDVFAVGKGGKILHYDGESWSAMDSGTDVWLKDVWGAASDDVFAVGEDGTILHYGGPEQ